MSSDSENRAEWAGLLADLGVRRQAGAAMGGPEKLAKRRGPGRLDARARIDRLCDPGSFTEIGILAGDSATPADAFVAGSATIDGRSVFVGVEDVSVAGGSIGLAGASKRNRLCVLAKQSRCPLIFILEGAGHRATNALGGHRPAPNDLQLLVDLAGLVPVVVVVAGPSAGHGALAAPLADHVIMVENTGCLFTAGPPLVAASTGEQVTKEELGGVDVHAVQSGLVHEVAASDADALDGVRRYLSYLPSHRDACPPPTPFPADMEERPVESILDLVPVNPRRPYDITDVLAATFDEGSVMEIAERHGRSLVTALARLGGISVAVVANQPVVLAGALDVVSAEKGARFIESVTAFGLPLVLLADNPGVLAGAASERAGILRAGAWMFAAQHRARVPKLHVTLRKAFGFGSSIMGQNPYDNQTVCLAFPGATLGGIPAGVGAATSKADAATTEALIAKEASGPWAMASSGTYDDIIDPRELRTALIRALAPAVAHSKEEPR